jgi:hypothetical protein
MQREINTLDTQDKITKIFTERCRHGDAVFVIDQLNALAELEEDGYTSRNKKGNIFNWLQACRSNSISILSSSANYKAYLETLIKENTDTTMHVYGGLSTVSLSPNHHLQDDFLIAIQREMENWWGRHKDLMNGEIVQGGYTKNEIEDFTGCIPLFLDYSVIKYEMDGRIQKKIDLNQDFFQDIYSDANG